MPGSFESDTVSGRCLRERIRAENCLASRIKKHKIPFAKPGQVRPYILRRQTCACSEFVYARAVARLA